jgi:ribosomal protein S18 acetylase RimI-like enzyme
VSARVAATDCLVPDAWLSRTLGTPSFALRLPMSAALGATLASLPDPAFCFAKVPAADSAAAAHLEGAGFRVVCDQLTFERSAEPRTEAPRLAVRRATPRDRDAVLDIAGTCFRFSRFHQDAHIGTPAANALKRAWMANCLDGQRGEEVLVALHEGRIAGFLAVLLAGDAAIIDLIGVAAQSQRRGIGASLVDAFIGRWGGRAARLRVGTQAANVPSVGLYERCGFRLAGVERVLHAHFRGGRAT